jgi:Xaa-Pro aminopeptidase
MRDIQLKLQRVRELLGTHEVDGILLQRVSNFAWLTDGAAGYVNVATTNGSGSLLVTADSQYLVTNNIEATRFEAEELLTAVGFRLLANPWHGPATAATELMAKLRLAADGPVSGAKDLTGVIAGLRMPFTPAEITRARELGALCAAAMQSAIMAVEPGMTEYEIAGLLAKEALSREAFPIVNLVATDDRIFRYRHPLPTAKRMDKYAMLVLCGRRQGLVASITRLVHFGRLPDEVRAKMVACATVDATLIGETRPGAVLGDVFRAAQDAYAATGFPNEWELHHQGGPAAYEPREFVATPGSQHVVRENEIYAWNPSITGVKSEDTTLVGPHGNEVLTQIDGWPVLEVETATGRWQRPAILERL